MEKIVNIQNVDPNSFQLQNYSIEDESLISNFTQQDIIFDPAEDYIEYFILDLNKNIIFSDEDGYPFYQLRDNLVTIDPQNDLETQGYTEGQYYTVYNFLKRKLASSPTSTFYIQDISADRTELRLNTTDISNSDVINLTTQFINEINSNPGTYLDFYLDFGNNKLVIANNILLETSNPNDPTILIKLYEPLPQEFSYSSRCWIVEQIAESSAYQIEITTVFTFEEQLNYISGPNFNLDIQDQINNSTPYYNENSLTQNYSLLGSGSLLYQINSLLAEKGIEINIDYSDYSEFVHFSSAEIRLQNFYYKLSLIEQYSSNAGLSNSGLPLNNFTSGSQIVWLNKINDIITNFDGYEYYLYYESGSTAWPKTNSTYPYINVPTTDPIALSWLSSQLFTASYYDSENKDNLIYAIPDYLLEDSDNDQYKLFVHMLGQNYDNVWIYLKDITNKFDNDNRLNYGISKDIVAQAIRDLGVKIYQNNFSTNDLYSALLGITTTGDLYNLPFTTGSLPTPSGYEYVNTYVTASSTASIEPVDDINKEIYKRIYHNLPMLLKKKGTAEGLRMLVNVYGVPDTVLRINEFGGKSYEDQSWDNFADQFNYSFTSPGTGYIRTNINYLNFLAESNRNNFEYFEFRFKTPGIPTTTPYYQVLSRLTPQGFYIVLEYTGSGYTSGSYSGSIPDNYNQYGTLKYIDQTNPNNSASIYLPFFDGGWWSVAAAMPAYQTPNNKLVTLYAANKIYTGYDGSQIGFQASSSVLASNYWMQLTPPTTLKTFTLSAVSNQTINAITYNRFSGSFQEWRIYNSFTSSTLDNIINGTTNYFSSSQAEKIFDDYVMNPYAINYCDINPPGFGSSVYPDLFFRAPLGSVLDNDITQTTRTSIHPAITQIPSTQSYGIANSDYFLLGTFTFESNYETIYQNQFVAGIQNPVSEKIRIVNMDLPPGNTLSQYISIQQNSPATETFTKDVNYLEAAFSPQDEVNDDIIAQLGFFNIGSYIGDPRQLILSSSNYYPDFNKLRDVYFSKYTHNYDLNDYIRLIKFYDNSLFKMIKDFTPARAGLASGLVIKPTLLERYKYPQPRVNTHTTTAFVGSPTSQTFNIPN